MSTLVARTLTYLVGFSASDWATDNRVLQPYEVSVNSDDGLTKQGDGSTAWSSLSYSGLEPSGGYTTTATAAGATTLTAASKVHQFFTGTTTQTVLLPVVSTLVLGERFKVYNLSTGIVTVQSSGANTVLAMPANTEAEFTCIAITGTDATSWNADFGGFSAKTGTGSVVLATSPTLTGPVIASGLTASGSAANDFSASTGAFSSSTGANTLGGAVTVNDATTPSITTAAGKTNTGFLQINGKTSGGFKLTVNDSTGFLVTKTVAPQTVGPATITIPDFAGVSDTLVYKTRAEALANKTATLAAGSTTVAPLVFTAGTNLTSPIAGANEFDGAAFCQTINTTSGRGAVPVEQYFRLTAAGSTISTIANYFGTTSNISLVAAAFYEIDIYAYFLNTTSGTLVWTLTNSAAPTSQNIYYEMSPVTGIVAPPGTATMLVGQIMNDATAAKALSATGALTDAVNHFMHMKIWLQNGTGTSLKIQATKSAGSITPGVGSYWKCRRLPAASTGTFAA